MVKYNFLIYHRDFNDFLEQLQTMGMVHVGEARDVEPDEETGKIIRIAESFEKINSELKELKPKSEVSPFEGDAYALVQKFAEVKDKIAKLEAAINKTEKDIDEALPWGEFDENDIKRIELLGIKPRFYAVPVKQFVDEWANQYPLYEINRDKGKVYFLLLQDNQDFSFELQEIKPPALAYTKLREELSRLNSEYSDCEAQMESLALSADILPDERRLLMEKIDFNFAQLCAQNEAEDSIKMLTAWLPKENKSGFETFLETQATVYFAEEKINEDEEPPVLLKNNRFTRLFEPITTLYSLPNYRELDSTPFFAPFFMLFFGFCLGDGGYGLLLLAIASFLKIKIKDKNTRAILSLVQYLGVATLLFGIITATFFGISLNQIKLDKIIEQHFGLKNNYGMMILSFILGFIQIIFAMFVNVAKIVRQSGWKYALSKLAWIVIIVGGLALFVLKDTSESIVLYTVGAVWCLAALIALFYNTPGKNPAVNLGSGLWTTYNMASGLLGDILSYVRLFILGLTGGIIGGVFNTLAMSAGIGIDIPVVSQLITLIILLFGHGLNLSLNILGAIVHPLRLTFVEFYKNSGFDGGGYPFKLFEKKRN